MFGYFIRKTDKRSIIYRLCVYPDEINLMKDGEFKFEEYSDVIYYKNRNRYNLYIHGGKWLHKFCTYSKHKYYWLPQFKDGDITKHPYIIYNWEDDDYLLLCMDDYGYPCDVNYRYVMSHLKKEHDNHNKNSLPFSHKHRDNMDDASLYSDIEQFHESRLQDIY